MYDTIKLVSPVLDDYTASLISIRLIKKFAVDCCTGEKIYEITTNSLSGSYDSRISVRLLDGRIRKDCDGFIRKVCDGYYLQVECSIHKLICGHNVIGGIDDIKYACFLIVNKLCDIFNVDLPYYLDWEVFRVDVAFNYNLGSELAVKEFFRNLNLSSYSRRRCNKYSLDGIQFPGTTTTVKMYFKGNEFKRHDKNNVINRFGNDYYLFLQDFANKVLRVEVEVNKKKLMYDFNKNFIFVRDLDDSYFFNLFFNEIEKVLKEGEKDVEKVKNADDVRKRLFSLYGEGKGRILLGTWFNLTAFGYEYTRDIMSKATFYRHVNLLKSAGCVWVNTNVSLTENYYIPSDFTLFNRKYIVTSSSFALVSV